MKYKYKEIKSLLFMLSLMAQKVPSPPPGDRAHLEESALPPPTHTHTHTHTRARARAQMKKLSPQKIYYFEKK